MPVAPTTFHMRNPLSRGLIHVVASRASFLRSLGGPMAAPDKSMEPRPSEGSWLLRIFDMISVSADDVLADARGMGIQVASIDELRNVRTSVLDGLAEQYIRNAKLM